MKKGNIRAISRGFSLQIDYNIGQFVWPYLIPLIFCGSKFVKFVDLHDWL